MKKLSVSVVIPTKDRGESFRRSIESCMNQTYPIQEIIVSEHGSAPETTRILRDVLGRREHGEYAQKPSIQHQSFPEENNITWNWMLGAMLARGEWIKYVFDDDWLEPQCVEVLAKLVSLNPYQTRVASCAGWFEPGAIPCYDRHRDEYPIQESVRNGLLSVSPVTMMIRKDSLIAAFGMFRMLPQSCFETGVGPNVLMNYGRVIKPGAQQFHKYTSQKLVHLGGDDLPGERRSLTSRLKESDPDTLYGNHALAYDLLDRLAVGG